MNSFKSKYRLVRTRVSTRVCTSPTRDSPNTNGQTTSLVTTSVAIILFALTLAILANDTSGKDILAATAAYAAVLVVFIGTSAAPAPSGSG